MEKYVNYITILPEAIISLVAVVLMLVDAYTGGGRRKLYAWISLGGFAAAGALAAGVLGVTVGMGLVESLLARLAFRRVPLLLTTAFLLCLFALLVAWKGGAE